MEKVVVSFSPPAPRSPAARATLAKEAAASAPVEESTKPLAMLVEGDDKVRAAVSEILRRAGFQVTALTKSALVLERVKQHVPAILILDADLPGVDVSGTLRIISRCRETRPVRVLVAYSGGTSALHIQAAKDAGAFATLVRPLKSRDILEAAFSALQSSNEERARLDAATRRKPPVARHVDSNNSLLVRKVSCPFHPELATFDRYTLRGNRILMDSNFFDIAVYKRAAPRAQFINFHQLAVMVCPKCLFASNHAGYFHDPVAEEEATHARHTHNEQTREAVGVLTGDRWELVQQRIGKLSGGFFNENRTLSEAIISYELALDCSKILITYGRGRVPAEFLRAGNYYLRLAHLHELAGNPVGTIEACCKAAVPLLEQAYTVAAGAHLFKAAYQMTALSIHFGEDKIAYQYLSQMIEFERDTALPNEERCALQKYLPRARRVWEDREMHRSTLLEAA